MSESTQRIPGRDSEGFVDLEALRGAANRMTPTVFAVMYCAPALLTVSLTREVAPVAHELTPHSGAKVASVKRTVLASQLDVSVEIASRAVTRHYTTRVAFLAKRPGNLFPHMITVGRAMNNDILLLLDTVSKFHGYFTAHDGTWSFTDQRSSNGTSVNGVKLAEGKSHTLAPGDRLSFGGSIELAFHTPESLCAALRERA